MTRIAIPIGRNVKKENAFAKEAQREMGYTADIRSHVHGILPCGVGGTCIIDPYRYKHPLCRCDKGYTNDKNGKCTGTLFLQNTYGTRDVSGADLVERVER
ncbi:hypothetical protein OS493_006540 [Desmophyllum pertusum]|uniref:EGF-like domain-containing protein n=1 Tax=Desmophyllum pertusum TaxID=174260 RepID=A0A9X0DB69_9CNID|nr:hypothetical protein OS493_006540 [Desmophyllum pertusum]